MVQLYRKEYQKQQTRDKKQDRVRIYCVNNNESKREYTIFGLL
jgi:hypothetical protein